MDIIETRPGGRSRVRFKTVPARRTSAAMGDLVSNWDGALEERRLPPLLAVGECPGVSVNMIRHVQKGLWREGGVECLGCGRSAHWRQRPAKMGEKG